MAVLGNGEVPEDVIQVSRIKQSHLAVHSRLELLR
jgi:hypothetical protein